MLDDDIAIRALIHVGRQGLHGLLAHVDMLPREHFIRGRDFWEAHGERLDEKNLAELLRGLTHYEQAGGHLGGSVSGVIYLAGIYARRFPATAGELIVWLEAHARNPYAPYGTLRR